MSKILVLSPLYNDENAFNIHAKKIESEVSGFSDEISFLVINDGSNEKPKLASKLPLTIVHLHRNIGHQKAISVGLAYAYHHLEFDKILIMDCDGEDRTEDFTNLIKASNNYQSIIFARRVTRQESRNFKLSYAVYKILFRLLTGKTISFGNFMLIPKSIVEKIIYYSEIWSHLAGGILKSNTPFITISTHRGKRYTGFSKMNYTKLLLHGLGAIGVFIDIVATRLLVFSIIMIIVSIMAIIATFAIKILTKLAIPGWASMAASSLLIILLQSFLLSLFTIFLYLSSQAQRKFIPAYHYNEFVQKVEKRTACNE